MRIMFSLLALAGACQLASGFAMVAALYAQQSPSTADTIGYSGIALAALCFFVAEFFIWREA